MPAGEVSSSTLQLVRGDQRSPVAGVPAQRFGEYDLLELIGRGGMGTVYRARHVRLDRVVALKRVTAGAFATAAVLRRFKMEAEAAAHVEHAGIVPIYEVGQYLGEHYYTVRYVDGQGLARHVAEGPGEGRARGRRPPIPLGRPL